ncbi:hypothetical protein FB45DRAFT_1007344 [Roridomyces roridus]|uniref:Uncharacterized protein n=1 Tax=Roridomyces roridus TaxID=1738132 RepID=A0AAD7BE26_9AGAR|nr:hypothetical protein FB45DRAFT_1007344 [Roridomyces roridus]
MSAGATIHLFSAGMSYVAAGGGAEPQSWRRSVTLPPVTQFSVTPCGAISSFAADLAPRLAPIDAFKCILWHVMTFAAPTLPPIGAIAPPAAISPGPIFDTSCQEPSSRRSATSRSLNIPHEPIETWAVLCLQDPKKPRLQLLSFSPHTLRKEAVKRLQEVPVQNKITRRSLVPDDVAALAAEFYGDIGNPPVSQTNVWEVYLQILQRFEHPDAFDRMPRDRGAEWGHVLTMAEDDYHEEHLLIELIPNLENLAQGREGYIYYGGVNNGLGIERDEPLLAGTHFVPIIEDDFLLADLTSDAEDENSEEDENQNTAAMAWQQMALAAAPSREELGREEQQLTDVALFHSSDTQHIHTPQLEWITDGAARAVDSDDGSAYKVSVGPSPGSCVSVEQRWDESSYGKVGGENPYAIWKEAKSAVTVIRGSDGGD